MPSIRWITISWPRWCISCSLAPSSISNRVLRRRLESGRQRDFLRELILGEGGQEIGELLATGGQRLDDRRLGGESALDLLALRPCSGRSLPSRCWSSSPRRAPCSGSWSWPRGARASGDGHRAVAGREAGTGPRGCPGPSGWCSGERCETRLRAACRRNRSFVESPGKRARAELAQPLIVVAAEARCRDRWRRAVEIGRAADPAAGCAGAHARAPRGR